MSQRLGRFVFVGCLGAVLQLSTLAVLIRLWQAPLIPATMVSVELAIIHNFFWHEGYTWGNRRCDRKLLSRFARFVRFHLANGLVSLVGNALLAGVFVTHLHLPTAASTLAAIALCSLVNFALSDRWVYIC